MIGPVFDGATEGGDVVQPPPEGRHHRPVTEHARKLRHCQEIRQLVVGSHQPLAHQEARFSMTSVR